MRAVCAAVVNTFVKEINEMIINQKIKRSLLDVSRLHDYGNRQQYICKLLYDRKIRKF